MELALQYFNDASSLAKNEKEKAMLCYFSSIYYLNRNDILTSIHELNKASSYFANQQLYKRLINTKTLSATQYRRLGYYNKSLQIDLKNLNYLKNINQKDLDSERIVLINNIAWTYSLLKQYCKSIEYYNSIYDYFDEPHQYLNYSICLYLTNDIPNSLKICMDFINKKFSLKNNTYTFYKKFITNFITYLNSNSTTTINKMYSIYTKNQSILPKHEKIDILNILMYLYEKNNNYYKSLSISKQIIELSITQ